MVLKNSIAINPLNWKRDDTYAPSSENLGDRIPIITRANFLDVSVIQENHPGLADAQVDVERGVVVCSVLEEQYVKPMAPGMAPPFGPASLYLMDYGAYWDNLRENVQTRIETYFRQK